MDRDEFRAALARSTSELVALTGLEHVGAYTRTSSTGKTVHVSAYTRDPGKMSNPDLFKEFKALSTGQSGLPQTQQRARLGAVTSEIRKRKTAGTWNSAAKPEAQTPNHKGGPTGLDMRGANAGPNSANNNNGKGKPAGKYDAALKQTADAGKSESTATPSYMTDKANEPEWEPGAKFATEEFLHKKEEKQAKEGGSYTPTPEEQKAWDARIDAMLAAPLDEGTIADLTKEPSTADKYLEHHPDGSVTFSKERQALHKRMIAAFLDGYKPQENPRYHMMGGGPAAGKSVMENANPEISNGHAVINADEIKGMLPEAWRPNGKLNAGLAHEESSHVTKLLQKEAFARKLGLTLDGTGDSGAKGVRKKLQQARDHGYEVHGYYVSNDVETAVQWAKGRGEKPPYREVAEPILRQTHHDVSVTFPQVMDEFDSVKLYESSEDHDGILTGEKKPGGKFEVGDTEAWKRFLDKGKD